MSDAKLEELEGRVAEMENLLFDDDNTSQRSVYDDLVLLRLIYNRFKSAKFFIGLLVGFLTIIVPAVYGVVKLVSLIRQIWKG